MSSSTGSAVKSALRSCAALLLLLCAQAHAACDYYIGTGGSDANPGTSGSPWAYTAINSKRTTYTGKTVCFQDGTYDVSSLMGGTFQQPALDIDGGTVGVPTIIKALNDRQAIITGGGALPYNSEAPMMGHSSSRTHQGYITIDGLKFTGGRTSVLVIGTLGASSNVPGITIQNIESTGHSDLNSNPGGGNTPGSGGGNASSITLNDTLGALISNNYIHDNVGHSSGSDDHLNGILLWASTGTVIEKNTLVSTGAILAKEDANQGNTVRYNYIDNAHWSADSSTSVSDFVGAPTGGLTQTSYFHHNIVLSQGNAIFLVPTLGDAPWTTNVEVYNNTLVMLQYGTGPPPYVENAFSIWAGTSKLKFYNNILTGAVSIDNKMLRFNPKAYSVWDYNLYPATGMAWRLVNDATGATSADYTTVASLRTAITAAGGSGSAFDTHAVVSDTPGFLSSGTLAADYYRITSGAAYQAGKTGGTSGGSTVNIGAWDGIVTQIGYVAPSANGIPANLRITAALNADHTIDTRYPLGNKPPDVSTLNCDWTGFPSLLNLQTGNAFSSSARAKFSGSAAATATLSIVTVSGDPADSSHGWSISGDNLVNSGAFTGAGALLVRGTATTSRDCTAVNWSYIAPPAGDTTAPTIPLGVATSAGAGSVTISWDSSSDPYTSEPGTGLKDYDVLLNGSAVASVNAPAGISPPLIEHIIGATDGTPATTQNGTDWDVSFGGSGIAGTNDQIIFRSTPIAADFTQSVKVSGITSGAVNPSFGLMARDSLADDAVFDSCRTFGKTDGSIEIRHTYRGTTGAARINFASVAGGTQPIFIGQTRVGSSWTCQYSASGGPWTAVGTPVTLATLSTMEAGFFGTSSTAATNATAHLYNYNLTTSTRRSYTHATAAGGTYTVKARDLKTPTGNLSAASAGVIGTPSGPSDTAPPTNTVVPSGSALSTSSIAWNCGTWSDPSGVANYTAYYATSSGGTYTPVAAQASNLFTQTGLATNTAYYLKCAATDTRGNTSAQTAFVTATTLASGSSCVLDAQETWESGAINPSLWDTSSGQGITAGGSSGWPLPASVRGVQSAVKRSGNYALRVNLNDEAYQYFERAEQKLQSPANFLTNTIYVMGFSVMVKDSDTSNTWTPDTVTGIDPRDPPDPTNCPNPATGYRCSHSVWDIVAQVHGTSTNRNPPFSLHADSGNWKVLILGDSINTTGANYERKVTYDCGPVVAGQWEDWTMRFRWGAAPSGSNGFWQIYRNGAQCVNDSGINWFTKDPLPPYFKQGLYKGWGKYPDGPHNRTIYHDEFRLGRESQGCFLPDVTVH